MGQLLGTRRFFLSGKNKISIINPCSSYCAMVCSILRAIQKLAILGLLCLLVMKLLQRDPEPKAARSAPPAARIFCIISTYYYRQESTAVHVKRTWSKHCDKYLFVSDDAHEELEPAVFLNLNDKWMQMRAHFEYVYKYHFDEGDWFLYSNDDNFVVVENLRYMLQSYSPKELIYFGCKMRNAANQTFMYQRSGIVFSSAALRQFVLKAMPNETICSSSPQGDAATEQLGRCLSNVNVLAGDSRDHLGDHRFIPFVLKEHLGRPLNASLEYHKYFLDRFYYDILDLNVPASSRLICTKFEYMPHIYNFYYLTYQVRIFGASEARAWNEELEGVQAKFKVPHEK
ncbi:glycoprotein-N-acetylgalactosamine 3-beta-galactosyltransferase 1 [Drosophila virilis]